MSPWMTPRSAAVSTGGAAYDARRRVGLRAGAATGAAAALPVTCLRPCQISTIPAAMNTLE